MVQPGVYLLNPEERGHGGQYIDNVDSEAVNLFSQNGIKDGADGERKPLVKREKCRGKPDHGIDCPGMEPPVQKGNIHGRPPSPLLQSRVLSEGS